MKESNKLPLKRVELSLTKFNEVAIPHHLDLLRQHKINIIKHEAQGTYARVRSEQAHAQRAVQQLRVLLAELEALRRRVRDEDLARFDELTQRSRDLTLRAVVDYLGVIESSRRALVSAGSSRPLECKPGAAGRPPSPSPSPSPRPAAAGSLTSGESVGLVPDPEPEDRLQLCVDEQELALVSREEVLRGWSELQGEVRALHDVWQHVQAAALHQRGQVAGAAAGVDCAADHVQAARAHLSAAERLHGGAWVAGGALAGLLAGGPVGLAVGLKAGAAAALAGSLLGALGVRALGRRRDAAEPVPAAPPPKPKEA